MTAILEAAQQAGSFSQLMSALKAADLEEMLQGEGPFTILAPTDDAFAKLPEETVQDLMQDTYRLKQVLLYHVLFGDVRSDDLAEIHEAPTVEGSIVFVEQDANQIKVNDAQVTQMDILTDNGVIHAIDAVLIPTILEP
ncbi:fasciclin domain-containing protein [Leptolyngbya ohadii]|uniref:fasciclin domain-containing protein n=1 Tax=Leptolyngbya ohadii TaxID=1962290 RepID=UPI000B59B803|nr:fasciclin domain-containing protein [Leptolyngbya ohadii]